MSYEKNKGGRPRSITPLQEIIVFRMYEEGKALAEIAYKNNISASTVYRIVKRFKDEVME